MPSGLEIPVRNPIEDGEMPDEESDKELEPQDVEGDSDGDSDESGDENSIRHLVPQPQPQPQQHPNIHVANFQQFMIRRNIQFEMDKIETIKSDRIDRVVHCSFRRLKLKLKIDRILLRSLRRKQWVVSQLEDRFLMNMEREKQTELVKPRTLTDLAKDTLMEQVMRATLLQLSEQLERFERRVAELKDLQKKYNRLRIRSQKMKAARARESDESNEGAGGAGGPNDAASSGGSKGSPDDSEDSPRVLQRDIAFLEKFVLARQRYMDHQTEFFKKVREHNKLLRQPLSVVPMLAPNAHPTMDPDTGHLVGIMHPDYMRAPILLKKETDRLAALRKKLHFGPTSGGQ